MAETVIRLPAGLDDAPLGDLAFESLLSLVEVALLSGWEEWVSNKPDGCGFKSVFSDLLYTVLNCSTTDQVGRDRLQFVLEQIVAEPFLSGVREALQFVKPKHFYSIVQGIKHYMLRGNEKPDLWEPMLKQNRTQILMMDVNNGSTISEDVKEMLEYEFGRDSDNDVLIVDIGPRDNGGTGLIHALVFEPDFILGDFALVGMGGADMLGYIKQHPRTLNTPYSLLTARTDYEGDPPYIVEVYQNAKYFIPKPFRTHDFISMVASHIELARANASQ